MKKEIIDKIIMISVCLLLLNGCGDKKQEEIPSNENTFHYEAQYNRLSNSIGSISGFSEELEDGVLLFPVTENGSGRYTVFYQDGESRILDADVASDCSFDNFEGCSSLKTGFVHQFTVYGNKLYYWVSAYGEDDREEAVIRRCNFDGSDDEEVLRIPQFDDEQVAFHFTIHKNKLYYFQKQTIYVYDLATEKEEVYHEFDEPVELSALFFEKDNMYIGTNLYQKDGKVYQNILLRGDLVNKEITPWIENMSVYYACEDFLITTRKDTGDSGVYYYDIKSEEYKKLLDDYCFGAIVSDKYIALCDINTEFVALFDKKGNALDTLELKDGMGYAQGIYNDVLYLSGAEKYYAVSIKDGKFQEVQEIQIQ